VRYFGIHRVFLAIDAPEGRVTSPWCDSRRGGSPMCCIVHAFLCSALSLIRPQSTLVAGVRKYLKTVREGARRGRSQGLDECDHPRGESPDEIANRRCVCVASRQSTMNKHGRFWFSYGFFKAQPSLSPGYITRLGIAHF